MGTLRRRDEIEALLAGTGDDGVAELLGAVRSVHLDAASPTAGDELAAVFASGLEGRTGLGPVPAAPAATPTRSRQRRRAVVGAAAGLFLLTGTGAAGALPGPAQTAFDRATTAVGIDRTTAPPAPVTPADDLAPAADEADDRPDPRVVEVPAPLPTLPDPAPFDEPPATPGSAPEPPVSPGPDAADSEERPGDAPASPAERPEDAPAAPSDAPAPAAEEADRAERAPDGAPADTDQDARTAGETAPRPSDPPEPPTDRH